MCVFRFFFFQAEDGIRDLVRSRGLGDVYKRQHPDHLSSAEFFGMAGDKPSVLDVAPSPFNRTVQHLSLIHI